MDQSATRETDLISLPYPLNQQALPKKKKKTITKTITETETKTKTKTKYYNIQKVFPF